MGQVSASQPTLRSLQEAPPTLENFGNKSIFKKKKCRQIKKKMKKSGLSLPTHSTLSPRLRGSCNSWHFFGKQFLKKGGDIIKK